MEWDYSLVRVVDEEPFVSEVLWQKGDEGWELVSVVHVDGGFALFFKKPAQPNHKEA
jgi:hypothetical protein